MSQAKLAKSLNQYHLELRETENSSIEAVVATLELAASERPELLDFLLDMICNSPLRFAAHRLASIFEVPLESVGISVYQACHHLDQLIKRRGGWREPESALQSPNVAALLHVCRARLGRVPGAGRRRLEATRRRLEKAYDLARSRAWIEAFIDPRVTGYDKAD